MKSSPFKPLKHTVVSVATASLLMASALQADCTYQLFSISSSKGTKISEFIDQLSDECAFSVIVSDEEAEKVLEKNLNKTKLKNLTIDEVLNLILKENNLAYTLENNILKISYLQTKTYNIDYIISQRRGEGSTDITLSSQSGSDTSSTTSASGSSTMSQSQSESGMKITSTDEVLFWEELDAEIEKILNRPEDSFTAEAPIINRAAGLVTVTATAKQIERLNEYIEKLQKKMQYQVLIDVKMYSVVFDDSSRTGIDWSQIYSLQNFTLSYNNIKQQNVDTFEGGLIEEMYEGDEAEGLFFNGTDFEFKPIAGMRVPVSTVSTLFNISNQITINDLVKFLKTQGDVYSISNPKVLTLNNQPALITVGTELFYKLTTTETTAGTGATSQVAGEMINSVFAGVLLDITPEISDDGTITLRINPSISEARSAVSSDNSNRTTPPDLNRRQLSSVVTVQDGNRIVLGGLINTSDGIDVNKVPLLGDIPILGHLFKSEEKVKHTEELVLIIEPHIVKSDDKGLSLADLGYTGYEGKDVLGRSKEANE
jgi:general secretion pathway protein D